MSIHAPISNAPQPMHFNARAFWLLADAGVFQEFVRTELIEGEICVVNSIWSRHARTHSVLTGELYVGLKGKGLVLLTAPSTEMSEDTVPEPDIAVATKAGEKALLGTDLLLAVEISDTSLAFDMGRKMQLYARHNLPEYWVADIEGQVIHQFWSPGADGYGDQRTVPFGEDVAAVTIAGLVVETAALL